MGTLSLKIGNAEASRTVDNANMQAVAELIYNYHVLPYWDPSTPQPDTQAKKLQAVADWLALHLRDLAREAKRRELAVQRDESDADAIAGIDI
jgi:hypothetical protein